MLLVTVAALFLACLPPEAVSQQCRSGVTDEIRQSVREQLRQGQNGTIPTVAVNCGQVCLAGMCGCVYVVADHATLQTTVCICLSNECSALQNVLALHVMLHIFAIAMHQNPNANDMLVLENMSLLPFRKLLWHCRLKTLRHTTSVFLSAYPCKYAVAGLKPLISYTIQL